MDASDIQFDASNGRILINGEYAINIEVEDFSTDAHAGEFSADYPVEGVEAWYNEDVDCVLDLSLERTEDY